MNFNRLALAGDNQNILPMCIKSFAHSTIHLKSCNCAAIEPEVRNCAKNPRRQFVRPTLARRHAQPVIRTRAGKREQRFHRVKPAHPLARLAALGKLTDVIVRVVLAAEKIAIQRQDDLRLVEMVNRAHRLAERLRRRALMDARINRVVGEPLRFRKFVAR